MYLNDVYILILFFRCCCFLFFIQLDTLILIEMEKAKKQNTNRIKTENAASVWWMR